MNRRDLVESRAETSALRAVDKHKDRFLAMLGHELRNPLAPIAAAVDLMRMRGANGNTRELDIIERQVQQLTTLVDDLLDVSRIGGGALKMRSETVQLADVLDRVVETTAPQLKVRKQRLVVDGETLAAQVRGDATRLVQVFTNLLVNASKYSPSGTAVHLKATREDEHVVVEIADEGPGIAPDVLPHVFEPFVQGERSLDRHQGGLGLGSPIVKNLVELHGGAIGISSSPSGTVVRVSLPTIGAIRVGAVSKVLLVDDNEDAAAMLAHAFSSLGFEVRVANRAGDALDIVETFTPDVAVLDLGLPDTDGYQLAANLHAVPALASLPLIALSGYSAAHDIERSRAEGFAQHLTKPADTKRLLDAIRAVTSN